MVHRHFSTLATSFLLFVWLWASARATAEVLPQAFERAKAAYEQAHAKRAAAQEDVDLAAKLARACFEYSELSPNSQTRAALAQEGIDAARFAIAKDPASSQGFLYLGLNLGELARTRKLSALSLLRQMEKALLRAAELEPRLDYAGADRSLGMLYLEAPGWPASVGSKRKAREHLVRAVAITSDYPDNHLSLMEAYARWDDQKALEPAIRRYRELLPEARKKYTGPEWEQAWQDWEERWKAVLAQSETK